jgi:integrase
MRIPTYITKHRQSYLLQRAVPRDLQERLCKRVWKAPGGRTLRDAQRLLQGFLEATDEEIRIARGELSLSTNDQIDRLPTTTNLNDQDVVEMLLTGLAEDTLSVTEQQRAKAVITGEVVPGIVSASELVHIATQLKSPAVRTKEAWVKELNLFIDWVGVSNLLHCTKQNAIDYRAYLLGKLSPNTTKTKLAYLTGLWSILEEVKGAEHIFRGITKRIKVTKVEKDYSCISPSSWKASKYNDIFLMLHYTGCRLAEIAGLRYEDILDDRILIRAHTHRPLKTAASSRDIPIHPELKAILGSMKGTGLVYPQLLNDNRWAVNLSKPCKAITGLNPHGHRHLVATRLREAGFNEAVVGKLLGHTPVTITGSYGTVPWSKLLEAVLSL